MKSLLILLLGLFALAVLTFFCIRHHTPLIEADLTERSATALKFEGMGWSQPSADGQIVTLNGSAPSTALRQKAGDAAAAVWGVDSVNNQLVVAKPVAVPDPYEFTLDYTDGKTVLSGYVPDEATRNEFVTAALARFGEGNVEDRLEIAPGAPEGFKQTVLGALMPSISRFEQAVASLRNTALSVQGRTISIESRNNLEQTISGAVPSQFSKSFDISAPDPIPSPYEFKLDFNGKLAILSGYVPDDQTRSDIIEAARQQFGSGNVTDRLKVAAGAPEGFSHTIIQGLIPNFEGYTQAVGTLQDSKLDITGTAPSGEVRDNLRQSLTGAVPASIATAFNIDIPEVAPAIKPEPTPEPKSRPAKLCQKRLDDLLANAHINFTTNRAAIAKSSHALLDKITSIAKECPETKIEVAGHTDSRGSNTHNQALSQRRAGAVLRYLVAKDIDIDRLTAVGYGETRPVADNTTAEGQAKNRRIELITREQ